MRLFCKNWTPNWTPHQKSSKIKMGENEKAQ
jgi:hypothetical protein